MRGLDAELSSRPISGSMTGLASSDGTHATPDAGAPAEQEGPFAGLGPFLEDEDASVFKAIHHMVLRQEQLAKNRLAQDTYWTAVKQGTGDYFKLEKVADQDRWTCRMAPGAEGISLSPVPNLAATLCNKVVEALMVDPPKAAPQADTDAEESERAAEIALKFLEQDGGEQGTRDDRLFWNALDAATSKAASFLHYWVDPHGNGAVPLQIKAHPQAVDASNPLVGPDGMPTTDYILRYVTADQQFTEDASKAAPQWVPKICIESWGREHVRTFPETADIHDAEKVIGLGYCTLSQAKRRWPETVGALDDTRAGMLCDWTPPRYLKLLPPALRARWKLSTGDTADPKGSSNDERVLFYYVCYVSPVPDYPKGASVYVSGAGLSGAPGLVLGRDTLTADVPDPNADGTTAMRSLDIPIVQVDLVQDADDGEPLGQAIIARVGGAGQALTTLGRAFFEALDINLHPATYTPVTSPVSADDVAQSRLTGQHIEVLSAQDYPHYEQSRDLPDYVNVGNYLSEEMHSAIGSSKASEGADKQQEVSGVARDIAVKQTNISLSRAQQSLSASYERHFRIKCQLAMKHFDAPQMIRYAGEDGAYKEEWWTGQDFSRVTGVDILPGSGTMMAPQDKIRYLQSMEQSGYVTKPAAAKAARPSFTKALGLPDDRQQQRIERQVGTWLKGVPNEQWVPQAQAFNQAKQQADAMNQQAQADYQQQTAMHAHATGASIDSTQTPPPMAPPPAPVQPTDPMTGAPMSPPWTPFGPLPMDDEPLIAAIRQERLSDLMATVRFSAQPVEWQGMVINEYVRMRTAVAASQAPPPMPKGVNVAVKAGAGDVAQAENAATHPQAAPPPPPAPKAVEAPKPVDDGKAAAMHDAMHQHMQHGKETLTQTHALVAQLAQAMAAHHSQPQVPPQIHVTIPPHAVAAPGKKTVHISKQADGSHVGHVEEHQ